MLVGQAWVIFQQLLYLRLLAARHGLLDEMAPRRTADGSWYPRKFKHDLAPRLGELIESDAPSPLMRPGARVPAPFALGLLFRAAGRFSDAELVALLAELGPLEASLRGEASQHAVTGFFSKLAQ